MVDPGVALAEKVGLAVVEAVLDAIGVEPILAFIFARTPQDRVQAVLDAQYNAQAARVDAEAERELRPAPAGKDVP